MLPPSVHSQYVRHKENTTSFVNWLFGQANKVMKAGSLPSQSADLSTQHLLPMAQACKKASIIMACHAALFPRTSSQPSSQSRSTLRCGWLGGFR